MRHKVLIPLFSLFLFIFTSCLREDDVKLPFETLTPTDMNDGWKVASPGTVNLDENKLRNVFENFHNDKEMWQPRSLLVVKDGFLVAETYTKDKSDITNPQAVWSCTKQILAIIVMKAIEDGYIKSLDISIGDLMPDISLKYPDKSGITLRQLMTMTSGIKFENSGLNGDTNKLLRREPTNSLDYILGLPMASKPGTKFNYSDGDPHIISAMLSSVFGTSVEEWSKTPLFDALNIYNYDWLKYPDNLTMGAFGLKLTPRDLAKFGQMILDEGKWHGENIISAQSVNLLTTSIIDSICVNYESQEFGLLWWINPEDNTPYMHGQGGQYVMINRENKLVMCITSEPNTQDKSQFSLNQAILIFRKIIDCIQ